MGKPLLDFEGFHNWLSKNGISVRYDVIHREMLVRGVKGFSPTSITACASVIIHDAIKRDFSGATLSLVENLLTLEARQNELNPVLETLEAAPPWDGIDRINLFSDIVGITDDFSRTLVSKWLVQALTLAGNDGSESADGILTFVGGQGIGKTSAARALALPGLFREGVYIDFRDKDSLIRATSEWIVEIGEAETSLRGDMEKLKAFVTNSTDRVRPPYGRTDIITPRRTSFIATVNSREFLRDQTGNRRFWTVELADIDLDALRAFNSVQLWQQVRQIIRAKGDFRLTREEQRQLAERNSTHEIMLRGEAEIRDIIAQAETNPQTWEFQLMSVSEFKSSHDVLRGFTVEQLGKVLDRLGIEQQRATINGNRSRARRLPVRRIESFLRRA